MITLKKIIKQYYAVSFYLLFAILIIIAISQKQYFFIDDYAAYSFANAPVGSFESVALTKRISIMIEPPAPVSDNLKYTPASKFYTQLTAVSQSRQFDYKNVYDNVKYEPAPPLPNILLHTICSFFPGVFSKWFAGILNLIFALLLLFISRRLLDVLLEERRTVDILSLVLVCSTAIITATAFFRMYIMAMFAATLESYILLKQVRKPITNKFCVKLFFATVLGAHIHHYCTLLAVFISVIFGVQLLLDRDFKGFGKFCFAQIAAGIVACAVFPPMLFTLAKYFGVKNHTAFGHATPPAEIVLPYYEQILTYIWMINCKLFGGFLVLILPSILFFAIYNMLHQEKFLPNSARRRYVMIFASVIAYILVVCARNTILIGSDSIEHEFRYLQPVWVLIMVGSLACFVANAKKYFKPQFMKYGLPILAILITLGGWYFADIDGRYMYYAYKQYENVRKPYYNADSICFTGDAISFYVAYELRPYKSLTWIKLPKFNPTQLNEFKNKNKLVICIQLPDELADNVFMELMKSLPMFEAKTKLPLFANLPDFECPGNIYYLDRRVLQ